MRDAETKGNSLQSGTSEKTDIHNVTPDQLGMGIRGSDGTGGKTMPQGNPDVPVGDGFVIR